MIRNEMPKKEGAAAQNQPDLLLLDEGSSQATPDLLIGNARRSLEALRSQRLRAEAAAKKAAVAETRKAEHADTRSSEELDMAQFENSLNHLDDTRPLMEQLGI
jgi:hypothetical protein